MQITKNQITKILACYKTAKDSGMTTMQIKDRLMDFMRETYDIPPERAKDILCKLFKNICEQQKQ